MKAWQQFTANLANLLKVKTIITLVIVFTFCYKTLQGVEITSEFVMVSTAVITYYFTKGENSRDKREFFKSKGDF